MLQNLQVTQKWYFKQRNIDLFLNKIILTIKTTNYEDSIIYHFYHTVFDQL